MGLMIIRHKARDYGQWRPIFNKHAEMQKAASLSNPGVYHSADSNRTEIIVGLRHQGHEDGQGLAASVDLEKAMTEAGSWTFQRSIFLNRLIECLCAGIRANPCEDCEANSRYKPMRAPAL